MKNKITLISLSFLLISLVAFSQKKVEASKIMQDIKAGKSISIKDATILGVLDFTYMNNALEKLPNKKKSSWWNGGNSDNTIKKLIDVKISFINCTFRDDVLAYIPHEDSGYTFIASFEDTAIFKGCNFKGKAMFKYSRFERDADFSGSFFDDDSTFKYAKFDKKISCLYLDNFDYIWDINLTLNDTDIKQRHFYKEELGITMANQTCQVEHMKQMIALFPYLTDDAVVVFDDTHTLNDCWVGKCGANVIWLLAQGFEIVRQEFFEYGVIMKKHNIK